MPEATCEALSLHLSSDVRQNQDTNLLFLGILRSTTSVVCCIGNHVSAVSTVHVPAGLDNADSQKSLPAVLPWASSKQHRPMRGEASGDLIIAMGR